MAGGAFLIHTAMKEIFHMLVVHDLGKGADEGPKHASVATVIFWILAIDIVFAFDTDAFTYVETDFTTSALAGVAIDMGQIDWSAIGAIIIGSFIYFDQGTPFPPAESWEYARIRLRIRSGVPAGEHPAGVVKSVPEKPPTTCLLTAVNFCAPVAISPGTVSVRATMHTAVSPLSSAILPAIKGAAAKVKAKTRPGTKGIAFAGSFHDTFS